MKSKSKLSKILVLVLSVMITFTMMPIGSLTAFATEDDASDQTVQIQEGKNETEELIDSEDSIDNTDSSKENTEPSKENTEKQESKPTLEGTLKAPMPGGTSPEGAFSLTCRADNGNVQAGGEAQMSFDSNSPRQYSFYATFRDLPLGDGRKITIELADGVRFASTGEGIDALTNMLKDGKVTKTDFSVMNGLQNNVPKWGSSSLERGTQKLEGMLDYNTTTITWNFSVEADKNLLYDKIKDAIKVTYEDGSGASEVMTIGAQVTLPKFLSKIDDLKKTVIKGSEVSINNDDDGAAYSKFLITEFDRVICGNYRITYECPDGVTMKLMDGNGSTVDVSDRWRLTDDGNNKYTLESTKPVLGSYSKGGLEEPVLYCFDSNKFEDYQKVTVIAKKHLINLDGKEMTEETGVTSKRIFTIVKEEEDVYVQYKDNSTYLDARTKGASTNGKINASTASPDEDLSIIGRIIIGNAGATDSKPKICELNFDVNQAYVKAFPTLLPEGNTLNEVEIKTDRNSMWHTVRIPRKVGTKKSYTTWISVQELGLTDGEHLQGVKYEMGVIPANSFMQGPGTGININNIIGEARFSYDFSPKKENNHNIGTIEVYDKNDSTITTGAGIIGTNAVNDCYFTCSVPKSYTLNAGDTETIGEVVVNHFNINGMATGLTVYICVPDDATIPSYAVALGSIDVTNNIELKGPFTSASGKTYYKFNLDGLEPDNDSLIGGWDSVGAVNVSPKSGKLTSESKLKFRYTLKTEKTTPGGDYRFNENMFFELENIKPNIDGTNPLSELGVRKAIKGNPEGFDGVKGSLFTIWSGEPKITIKESHDITVQSESKANNQIVWSTYDVETEPNPLPIGIGGNNFDNIKVEITNQSGQEAPAGTTIWQPIPKMGEDWGILTANSYVTKDGDRTTESPFSIELRDKIESIDTAVWDIYYGIDIRPIGGTTIKKDWDVTGANSGAIWKDNVTEAELSNVNCIKLVSKTGIPCEKNGKPYSTEMIANVKVPQLENGQDIDRTGRTLVIRPLIYRNLEVKISEDVVERYEGIVTGSPAALQVATGQISGRLFYDANRNGKFDLGENVINGTESGPDGKYIVNLYKKGTGTKDVIDSVTVDENGEYSFSGLATGDRYNDYYGIEITNETGGDHDFRLVCSGALEANEMIVTVQGQHDGYSYDNAFLHRDTGAAYVETVVAISDKDPMFTPEKGGVYNCGVYWDLQDKQTKITFKSDTTKGKVKNETVLENYPWVTLDPDTDTEKVYSSSATDYFKWPSVISEAGYEFDGWKLADASGNPVGAILPQPTTEQKFGYENLTYIAQYSEKNITIHYESEDVSRGTVGSATDTIRAISGTPEGRTANAKNGYTFKNWTDESGKVVSTDAKFVPKKENGIYVSHTYTAHFIKNAVVDTDKEGAELVKKKVVADKAFTEKEFSFSLEADGAPANEVLKSAVSGSLKFTEAGTKSVDFGDITFTKTGTYNFKVKENATASDSWVMDSAATSGKTVTVVVTEKAGELKAEVTGAEFTNTYTSPIVVDTKKTGAEFVKKTVESDADSFSSKNFTFTIEQKATDNIKVSLPVASQSESFAKPETKAIDFGNITFTKEGTYNFTVKELGTAPSSWTLDSAAANGRDVKVVIEKKNGSLTATVTGAEFTNKFAAPTKLSDTNNVFKVKKSVTGTVKKGETFNFRLTALNGAPMPKADSGAEASITITDDGSFTNGDTAEFGDIEYKLPGEYKYEIAEIAGSSPNYTYDDSRFTATVEVEKNDEGTSLQIVNVTYKKGTSEANEIEFINAYHAKNADTFDVPSVNKVVDTVYSPTAKNFTFEMEGVNDAAKEAMPADDNATITTNTTGMGNFGKISYTKEGEYTYKITEKPESYDGWTMDDTEYELTVKVEDVNGKLTLTDVVLTKDGEKADSIVFTNVYNPAPTTDNDMISVDPPVKKQITGDKPSKKETFTFELKAAEDNQPMPEGAERGILEKNIKGEGKAEFGAWTYNEPGTYVYTVSEKNTGISNYDYDGTVYTITDVVTDDGNGHLVLDRTVKNADGDGVTECKFINKYKAPSDGNSNDNPNGSDKKGKDSTDNKDKSKNNGTKTGDDAKVMLMGGIAIAVLLAMFGIIIGRRRQNN